MRRGEGQRSGVGLRAGVGLSGVVVGVRLRERLWQQVWLRGSWGEGIEGG